MRCWIGVPRRRSQRFFNDSAVAFTDVTVSELVAERKGSYGPFSASAV